MGKLTRARFAILDSLIEERGEDWLLDQITSAIAKGDSHTTIAGMFGMSWGVLREWIESNCAEQVASAYRARADLMVDQATQIAVCAQMESLPVDKFQAEFWLKLAGKADRSKYGERTEVAVTNTHTFDIRGLLAQREAKLESLIVDVVPENVPNGVCI